MPADLALITETWRALQPVLAQDKCAGCECLRAALVELKLALTELPEGGQTDLGAHVEAALEQGEPHACLGCDPCHPGGILATFYREQQAREAAAPSASRDNGLP